MSVQMDDEAALVAAAKADLAARPVHTLGWRCPVGCGQGWSIEVRLERLESAAHQLVRTVERHMEVGCTPL